MSNTIGHGLLLPTVLKHQIKTSPSLLSNGFCGQRLTVRKSSFRRSCVVSGSTQAVLATYTSSELGGRFKLQGDIEMQVDVKISSVALLEIQITNSTDNLYLHWGGTRNRNEKWVLPSRCPEGTKVFNDQALRTPFLKSGSVSLLKVEIDDPAIEAIEFLIVDERQDRWYKDNGQNFYVKFPKRETSVSNVGVPEDLVQIQAYLRWERNGKQTYTPEQEKKEFEEARKELQRELEKGNSLDDVRKKITKGEIKTEVLKKLGKKIYRTPERITRKKRDVMQLLRKSIPVSEEEKISVKPKDLSALQIFSKTVAEQSDTNILNKKTYRLADKELLVLVTNTSSKTGVHVATDMEGPLTLHWALSEKAREWLVPPADMLPVGSISLDKAAETQFSTISVDGSSNKIQVFELYMEDSIFVGMPFVLRHGDNWVKDNDSDFYVEFTEPNKPIKDAGDGKGTAKDLLDKISSLESVAEQSFMHRFNIAADLIEEAKDADELGLAGILVWMRFMATRQLIWNKNYCVKPREISQAQDRLIDKLQNVYSSYPQYSELLRMIMSSVGRGGQGDVGQRIRDEILVIQKNNKCKGGMMEEWHQKLHNNTSPDDVVICQALMNYIKSDLDISVYWETLNSNGITKERLLSYDRAIHNEPDFSKDQKEGLLRDLGNYLRTLKAVHSGADLESAISNCIGYISEGRGMVGVKINSISGLPSGFPELLQFVLEHVEDKNVEPLLEGLLETRQELKPLLSKSNGRLKDLLFLDIALDSTVRTAIERSYEVLKNAKPEKIMYLITLLLENLILSSDNNEDLIYCWKGWNRPLTMVKNGENDWALFAKSVLDRTRLALASKGELYHQLLQPSAEYLGALLGIDQWAVSIFTEEMIRSGSAASLSSLVNRIDPVLRNVANLGSWQVISPVEAVGYIVVVDELLSVQNISYEKPTILVAKTVSGEEEIPDGTVAVLTSDMPDVLSHVSVRARNSKVCFATCFDTDILNDLRAKEGKLLNLKPTSADITYSEVKEETLTRSNNLEEVGPSSTVQLIKKQFNGRYAVSSEDFTSEMVGAKSRNIAYLKGKVPSFVGIPTSVALPFGVFEKVLSDELNQGVSEKLQILKKQLEADGSVVLGEIRKTVLDLSAPSQLVQELKNTMQSSEMPWPGDEGEQRWEQAWLAIKKVWASKWNERAYLSTKKVKLDHDYLCMAVLVQEIINADYAFVIHTTNPSSGDSSEIYAEVVKGLGETLVGAYPGRALSFISKKDNLDSPKVLGYPSKPIGLFIRRSIIFRSDSNGEDLEGYAGAGLYDSVPMDEEDKVVVDYSCDPLIVDFDFQKSILSSIARVGDCIEKLYGSPQDIEGVVRDGKIYVVQTRPQM
ncbi:putative alpha-glucan, water dikinase [Helianthus annuus]|uniref:alpha-glucan, water dikinase n=1 Tax=Helianthus annuus TaxID=4232 RepID=A0A251T6S0_HELAN|nr:alpha-glucan water dikinase 1, chloroplastic isoform X2 [Helianthus annuus]KAF5779799.1 putative alpha-glucan, water dikinase [Helianthus annuus]KAJ0495437.1 putative alpha-glucan, water dikinase [Helianthus annuus]KAJ0676602.1 putative alpha-glucan, water dikinase [Helianthus annuus]KAJ0679806.1 putative alpha-glucan, water dikinase [Helianthus annuus]